jgi:GNAT superfamily N-acetyltransferase
MTTTIRRIQADDLPGIARFPFTVSIREPMTDMDLLRATFEAKGFWTDEAGAVAIVKDGRMVGTCQFYRAAPCIHGFELGYILHDPARRGQGWPRRRCGRSPTCCSPSGRRSIASN